LEVNPLSLTNIKFGTDGWRAIIAQGFTFSNLERVAQAYASFLKQNNQVSNQNKSIVIGYDNRFHSENFALRAAEVLSGNNFNVHMFAEAAPTPLVSWSVRELNAAGGIVITASHNPSAFNGFKIKAPFGGSAPVEVTMQVEALVDKTPVRISQFKPLQETQLNTARESYINQISSYIDIDLIKKSKNTIAIDSMHGSGGTWVESFLKNSFIEVETLRSKRDPLFGNVNPEPIDKNLELLKKHVLQKQALIGLATDGDADRLGAVNELGQTMTMHEVAPIMLLHLTKKRAMKGGVVRTFSQSVLTNRIAQSFGLKVYETPIGFKYVADLMLSEDILIGAEESGGIGVKGHIPERDGILNALLLLEAVISSGQSPSALVKAVHAEFGAFYFNRVDLHKEVEQGQILINKLAESAFNEFAGFKIKEVSNLDGTKFIFDDDSWILFRQSGTEPVFRIYSEATSVTKVQKLLATATQLTTAN
jgi:phosphomannomutase